MDSIIMNFDDSSDVNAAYNHIKALYPNVRVTKSSINVNELFEDEHLFNLAAKRKQGDTGVRISFDEHLAKRGLTSDDIERMEDVEIE